MSKLRTTTKVQLTIEVESPTTWSPGCSARQIFDNAGKEAVNMVQNALCHPIRVIGTPKIIAVSTEQTDDA